MLARTKKTELAKGRGLIVGNFDEKLAMLLIEHTRNRCDSVHWVSNLNCQYTKKLKWNNYRHIFCSKDFYQDCLDRLNRFAHLVNITVVLTSKSELLSFVLLPMPTSIKKTFFHATEQRLTNTVAW